MRRAQGSQDMRIDRFTFGSIRIDGEPYAYDVVIDRGGVRKLVSSESSFPVQIADVMAGAIAYVARAKTAGTEDRLAQDLGQAGLLDLVVDSLSPTPLQEFVERGRPSGHSADPIEATIRLLFPRNGHQ